MNCCIQYKATGLQKCISFQTYHYSDVIMGTMATQFTSLTILYSTVYSDADQRKHQSSASLAFVRGIHRRPLNSSHKGPVTRKMFSFDDVIMHRGFGTAQFVSIGQYLSVMGRCHLYCAKFKAIGYTNSWGIAINMSLYWQENITGNHAELRHVTCHRFQFIQAHLMVRCLQIVYDVIPDDSIEMRYDGMPWLW